VNLREATEAFQREAIASALAANPQLGRRRPRAGWTSPTCTGWGERLGLKGSRPDKSSAG
jgi:anaerobic nitric oxide reductase transcription regulator